MTITNSGKLSLGDLAGEFGGELPHGLSEYSEFIDKTPDERVRVGEFYGTSANTLLLPDKTFEVYTTKIAIIPIAQILDGTFDEYSDGNDPIQLVSVQNAVNGTVTKVGANIEFTSTAGVGVAASFDYTATNSISKTKVHTVTMSVLAIPPILCTPDTFNLQQGESLLLSRSALVSNDIDGAGGTLTVTGVRAAVGGEVSLNNDTITFLSTGLSGQPAEFEYTVVNNLSDTQVGKVYINITPLPEQELYIYPDTATTTAARQSLTPPTVLDVFNTWGRFDGNSFYPDKNSASGNAAAWQFLNNPDRVLMPNNVSPPNGFISNDRVDNYTFEVTLTSDNADDDTIGLVAAFTREGSVNNILTLLVNKGGNEPSATGCGVYFNYYNVGSSFKALKEYNIGTAPRAWSGDRMRVKVQRQQDIIRFYVSDWNNEGHYNIASEMVIDLNSDPDLHRFKGKQSYGYITYSQPNSTYLDITFNGGLDRSMICDVQSNTVWLHSNNTWSASSDSIQEVVGFIRKAYNPETQQRFLIKESVIDYLGRKTLSSNVDPDKLLSEQQNLVLTSANNVSGAAVGVRVVALYESNREEINHLKDKPLLQTTTAHSNATAQSRYNRMGGFNWFADNGINIDAGNFVGGTVVFDNGMAGRISQIGNNDGTSAYLFYDVYHYDLFDLTL